MLYDIMAMDNDLSNFSCPLLGCFCGYT